jgi:hypothetical protein
MQTRLGSLIETLINIGTGFLISMLINIWILPQVGCQVTTGQNVFIVVVFTVASIIRSYVLRRIFNALTVRSLRRDRINSTV